MTRMEQMDFLVGWLLEESRSHQGRGLPADGQAKWELLRSLMNIRHPGPISNEFLRVQDALLAGLAMEKGIVDADALPAVPGEPQLVLWRGDITTLEIDAIVNAANSALLGCFRPCHNCIDNAIHTYAGIQLRNECDVLMRGQGHGQPAGTAKITSGYNLPCKHVLHTVGPVVSGIDVTQSEERLLARCYRSSLELAAAHHLRSIAFCCISTGVFRFPKERAAQIAIRTVREHLVAHPSIKRVVFNVFTEEDHAVYRRLLGGW